MRYFIKYFTLKHREKRLVLQALYGLVWAKLAIRKGSANELQWSKKAKADGSDLAYSQYDITQIKRVRLAISHVAKILPFECQCLAQALCAKKILLAQQIQTQLHRKIVRILITPLKTPCAHHRLYTTISV